ncbi:hypothetical protein CHELA41_24704 [Hyphomicrobiales bacterium]|nr:hypothetical protein CHELA41_24704 [Hyphomicrobiales bacterium]
MQAQRLRVAQNGAIKANSRFLKGCRYDLSDFAGSFWVRANS